MIKIRLSRLGAKNNPVYRIVAIDERKKREGEALEVLGTWHPKKDTAKIITAKIDQWIQKGAKLTPAVSRLLAKNL